MTIDVLGWDGEKFVEGTGGGGGLTLPLTQNLTFSPDATHDIGPAGFTPRDIIAGRYLAARGGVMSLGDVVIGASGDSGAGTGQVTFNGANVTAGASITATTHLASMAGTVLLGPVANVGLYTFNSDNIYENVGNTWHVRRASDGAILASVNPNGRLNASEHIIAAGNTEGEWAIARVSVQAGNGHFYFRNDNAIWMRWNGSEIDTSHPFAAPGVRSAGNVSCQGNIIFANDANITLGWAAPHLYSSQAFNAHALHSRTDISAAGRLVTNNYDAGWSNNFGGNVVMSGNTLHIAGANIVLEDRGNGTVWLNQSFAIAGRGWQTYNAALNRTAYCDENGNLWAQTVGQSSRVLKTDITPFSCSWALDVVRDKRLQPARFQWKATPGKHHLGLVAEEVAEVAPEAVGEPDSGKDAVAGWEHAAISAILWAGLRELSARVEQLEQRA